jgi:hypothetical protein
MTARYTAFFSLLLAVATAATAQTITDDRPIHRIPRVEGEVRVDAILDEPLWREALVLEPKLEVRPGENIPAPVRTEAFLAYGSSALYVAFKAFDPEPARIRAHLGDRDNLGADDWVGIVLDCFDDHRRNFDFLANPLGVQFDEVESSEGEDAAWDAIWDSAGRITPDGYVVEMAIPFSSLRFQRTDGDQIWSFDLLRSWPRDVDHRIGLFARDRSNNCYLCQADRMIGFAGASPGRNLELDPTFASRVTQARDGFPSGRMVQQDRSFDFGLTGTWGMTPNLALSGTVNPDFSQVEADAAQLDINTQFALFYPEKRPFFLEGGDLFNTRINAVYTRTVADPNWGVKLTGKEGRNAIAAFVAHDTITNLVLPGAESSTATSLDAATTDVALRYRRDVGTSSTLGVLVTDREGAGYFNRLAGVDGVLKLTPRDAVRFQALGSRTGYPGEVSDSFDQPEGTVGGSALDVFYLHDTRSLDWYARVDRVTPGFRADLGYVPQVGYDFVDVGWQYTWNHDPGHWYTTFNVGSGYEEERGSSGVLLHRDATFWLNYEGPYQSHASAAVYLGTRGYHGAEFTDRYAEGCYGIRPVADLWLHLAWAVGDRIDYANVRAGDVLTLTPTISVRAGARLTIDLTHTYQRLDVAGGRLYTANISDLWVVYQFTRRAFVRAIVQRFDYRRAADLYVEPVAPRDETVLSQLLLSYKVNPRAVVFLGYSDTRLGDEDVALTQLNRTVFFKLGYAWVM